MNVFYFNVRHVWDDAEGNYAERDVYGFLVAEDFNHAMAQITEYFRDDLISTFITEIGDNGLLSIENKQIAELFKKEYEKTHGWED